MLQLVGARLEDAPREVLRARERGIGAVHRVLRVSQVGLLVHREAARAERVVDVVQHDVDLGLEGAKAILVAAEVGVERGAERKRVCLRGRVVRLDLREILLRGRDVVLRGLLDLLETALRVARGLDRLLVAELGVLQVLLRLLQRALKIGRVDERERLTGGDLLADGDVQRRDLAICLEGQLRLSRRGHRSRDRDRLGD